MRESVLEEIRQRAARLRAGAATLVIDGDAHISDVEALGREARERYHAGDNYYHGRPISAEDLIAEMDMAGVDMTLVWQNPAATYYPGDLDANAASLLAANRYIRDAAARYPQRFFPAGWVDPKGCGAGNALAMVDTLIQEFGFTIVKMNPAQNRFPIDSPEVVALVDRIVEQSAVPAFHFGADSPFTPADGLQRVAERHPDHPVIAVHMGGGGAGYVEADDLYRRARRLGLERPNIVYIFSAMRDTHIESALITYQLAGEPFSTHLCCGSDAPYGRVSWNFGGFRAMFQTLADSERHPDPRIRANPGLFTPETAQRYLGGNLARILAESCDRLRAAHLIHTPVCR